jgi:predicted esterase
VDESIDQLGMSLQLPDQYEALRPDIEKQLPALGPVDFVHQFRRPPTDGDDNQTIVALHGTGGSEHDLIALAGRIRPTSAVISPRGMISENGLPRFFRRLAEGVFDEKDVIHRAHELADFIESATARYGRSPDERVALGYSNGANIAAAVMMLRPETFRHAILLRPMLPLQNASTANLEAKNILILQGRHDRVIPAESTRRLIEWLQAAGAAVTAISVEAGHELSAQDLEAAARWLSDVSAKEPAEMA